MPLSDNRQSDRAEFIPVTFCKGIKVEIAVGGLLVAVVG